MVDGQLVGGMLQESGGQADLEALELGIKSYYENTFQEGGVDSFLQRLKLDQEGQLDGLSGFGDEMEMIINPSAAHRR